MSDWGSVGGASSLAVSCHVCRMSDWGSVGGASSLAVSCHVCRMSDWGSVGGASSLAVSCLVCRMSDWGSVGGANSLAVSCHVCRMSDWGSVGGANSLAVSCHVCRMSDWGSVGGASSLAISCPPSEYLSLLTTATLASPVYRATPTNGHADRRVSPGGSGKRLSFIEESLLAQFCADDDNVEDCIAFLNQVFVGRGLSICFSFIPDCCYDHLSLMTVCSKYRCCFLLPLARVAGIQLPSAIAWCW